MLILSLALAVQGCLNNISHPPLPIWNGHVQRDSFGKPEVTYLTPDLNSLVLIDGKSAAHTLSLNRRVSPVVRLHIDQARTDSKRKYRYDYAIRNETGAHDAISQFTLLVPTSFESGLGGGCGVLNEKGWSGSVGLTCSR